MKRKVNLRRCKVFRSKINKHELFYVPDITDVKNIEGVDFYKGYRNDPISYGKKQNILYMRKDVLDEII